MGLSWLQPHWGAALPGTALGFIRTVCGAPATLNRIVAPAQWR